MLMQNLLHGVNTMVSDQINKLSGIEFEGLCAAIISDMGFQIELTKASGDGGIDIIARNSLPLYRGKYIVQCKRYSGTVGEPILRDLYGVVMSERANKGILMTTGTFTRSAIAFAEGKPLELIDITGIESLLAQGNYDIAQSSLKFDTREIEEILENGLNGFLYTDLCDELSGNTNSLSIRGRIALLLYNEATDSYSINDYSPDERKKLLEACEFYLEEILKKDLNNCKDQVESVRRFICFWIYARSTFLLGKNNDSEKAFYKILEWDAIQNSFSKQNGLTSCLFCIVADMISFYAVQGERLKAQKLLTHPIYGGIINQKKQSLATDIRNAVNQHQSLYWQNILKSLELIVDIPCFYEYTFISDVIFESPDIYDHALQQYILDFAVYLNSPEIYNMQKRDNTLTLTNFTGEEYLFPV